MKETATSLIFRIGYKRLHERERKRKRTIQSRKPPLYTRSQLTCVLIATQLTCISTHTGFSHAIESRTNTPTLFPRPRHFLSLSVDTLPEPRRRHAGIQQPNLNLPNQRRGLRRDSICKVIRRLVKLISRFHRIYRVRSVK